MKLPTGLSPPVGYEYDYTASPRDQAEVAAETVSQSVFCIPITVSGVTVPLGMNRRGGEGEVLPSYYMHIHTSIQIRTYVRTYTVDSYVCIASWLQNL